MQCVFAQCWNMVLACAINIVYYFLVCNRIMFVCPAFQVSTNKMWEDVSKARDARKELDERLENAATKRAAQLLLVSANAHIGFSMNNSTSSYMGMRFMSIWMFTWLNAYNSMRCVHSAREKPGMRTSTRPLCQKRQRRYRTPTGSMKVRVR